MTIYKQDLATSFHPSHKYKVSHSVIHALIYILLLYFMKWWFFFTLNNLCLRIQIQNVKDFVPYGEKKPKKLQLANLKVIF